MQEHGSDECAVCGGVLSSYSTNILATVTTNQQILCLLTKVLFFGYESTKLVNETLSWTLSFYAFLKNTDVFYSFIFTN